MKPTQKQSTIYEINTPIFLHEVGQRVGHTVTLADVPDSEWDTIARPEINTVWFMGVWRRSPIAKAMAADEPWLKDALPDMQPDDFLGSAYSIQDYAVDESLGGNEGLAAARAALKKRGIAIILDFVPNHVAIDHGWTTEHPDYFLTGTTDELIARPNAFIQTPGGIFAKGKDPHFEPWSDVLQLNTFSLALRQEVVATLQMIASMSDGVRCDMAMLMMNTIFKQTWDARTGEMPTDDYWPGIIAAVRQTNPDFLFLAEVYWDKQQDLLDQGFDLCYDKDLYDYLLSGSVPDIKRHLHQSARYQNHLLRFIENHDEERAAHEFALDKHMAAAIVMATLPGAQLYYDGQREGRQVRVPVHLGRRVDEPVNETIADFYDKLFAFIVQTDAGSQDWRLLSAISGFFPRESDQILVWEWTSEKSRRIVAVNYGPQKAYMRLAADLKKPQTATDIGRGEVNPAEYINGSRLHLQPWQHVVLKFEK